MMWRRAAGEWAVVAALACRRRPAPPVPPPSGGPLRIALVTSELNPHELRQAQGLAARGAEVHLVDPYGRRPALLEPWRAVATVHSLGAEWEEACRTRRLPVLDHGRLLARRLSDLRIASAQASWLQSDGLALVASGFRPCVLYPFGSDLLLRARDGARAASLTRAVLRGADRVVFQSEVLRAAGEALAGRGLPPWEVIPYGVDTSRFRPGGGDGSLRSLLGIGDRPLVVSTRNLAPVYGVDRLLRAFAAARARVPGAFLALAGDGPLRGELESLARDLDVGADVRFLGRVDRDLFPRWLPDADVYASASVSDGASVSLMEGMACGLPCVVSDIPANRGMVEEGKTGHCADFGGPAAADRLAALLSDRARAKGMGGAARALAESRYDAARAQDRLWALHAGLAGRPVTPGPGLSPDSPRPGA